MLKSLDSLPHQVKSRALEWLARSPAEARPVLGRMLTVGVSADLLAALPSQIKEAYHAHLRVEAEAAKNRAYQLDPYLYAREVLGVEWWSKQQEVARAITEHRKVFVKASHSVGKTHLIGGIVNWHVDCYNPSKTLTTAPTQQQAIEVTWGEIRAQRQTGGLMPKAPRIEFYKPDGQVDPNHFAAGYTARDDNAFQGRHEENMLIVFEEAVGIEPHFWEAADGMLSSGEGNRWVCIMNPTDTSSKAYNEELSGGWHVITISALDHPNLHAELYGLPKPFPKAVSLSWVEEKFEKWCQPIPESDRKPTDICWPPMEFCEEQGIETQWYRPGPLFEGRVLGRWPSQSVDSVWSESLWISAIEPKPHLQEKMQEYPPEIGCDRARFGDDFTSIFVRRGAVVLHAETHNGWNTPRTLMALKDLAGKFGRDAGIEPKQVLVKVDDFQGGVVDVAQGDGWNFVEVNSASTAIDDESYPNRRSELWFATAERAEDGVMDLSLLDSEMADSLRRQLMAPKWKPNGRGQRVVEDKAVSKVKIKRSPDDADALNLCFAPAARSSASFAVGGSGRNDVQKSKGDVTRLLSRLKK